jgi:hypothetical protein
VSTGGEPLPRSRDWGFESPSLRRCVFLAERPGVQTKSRSCRPVCPWHRCGSDRVTEDRFALVGTGQRLDQPALGEMTEIVSLRLSLT